MSLAPLLGLPGKVKTMIDRLTADRATKLDNLNATVSSRAPSATALLSTTWTNARAAKLDNLDALISSLKSGKKQFQLLTSNGTWVRPAGHIGDVVEVTMIGGGQGGSRGSSSTTTRGGSAAEQIDRYPVTVSGDVSVTIGQGGARRTGSTGTGTAGTDTSFGALAVRGGDSASLIGPPGADDSGAVEMQSHSVRLADAAQNGIGAYGGRGYVINGVRYGTGGQGDTNSDADSTDGLDGMCLVEWWEEV